MALITAANYKTSRGIAGTDYDTRIGVGVTLVERWVREWCGRDLTNGFESAERTEVYSGTGTDTLYLREWPATSIASIKYRKSATEWDTAISSNEYYIDTAGNRGRVYRVGAYGWSEYEGQWSEGNANIQVVYTGGYSSIPADLSEACYILLDSWFRSSGTDQVRLASDGLGAITRVMNSADETAAKVTALLSPWRRAIVV